MNKTQLDLILAEHRRWLDGEPDAKQANLTGADLQGLDLSRVDLRGAEMQGVDFSRTNLGSAKLDAASLRGAKLKLASLVGVDMRDTDLTWADLRGADMTAANLEGADMQFADLAGADLTDSAKVCRMELGGLSVCVYADRTSIDCETRPNDFWLECTSWAPDVSGVSNIRERHAAVWWAIHGGAVKAVIRCVQTKGRI